jgi:hypothetical protein
MRILTTLAMLLASFIPALAAVTWPASTNAPNQTFYGTQTFAVPFFANNGTFSGTLSAPEFDIGIGNFGVINSSNAPVFLDTSLTNSAGHTIAQEIAAGAGGSTQTNISFVAVTNLASAPISGSQVTGATTVTNGLENATTAINASHAPSNHYQSGNNSANYGNGTGFFWELGGTDSSSGAAYVNHVIPSNTTFTNVYLSLGPALGAGTNAILTLMTNNVASSFSATMPAGSPDSSVVSNLTTSISVVAGSLVSWRVKNNTNGVSSLRLHWSWEEM